MTKQEFYHGKQVVHVEWWLHDCDLPVLTWGRLRVFDDGTADTLWGPRGPLNGFTDYNSAACHFAEDENIRFADWDVEDEARYRVRMADVRPPDWEDNLNLPFHWHGAY